MEREINIFLHIPKTGGVSTTDAIKDVMPDGFQVFPRYAIDGPIEPCARIIIGHLAFGCHWDVESNFSYRYLTQLRNPVDRLFSHWAYLQRQSRMDMGLMELLESDRVLVDNLQVRQLSGMPHKEPDISSNRVTEADFRQAKYNLAQHFDWIGVLDYYRASIARLSMHLGVDMPVFHHNLWTHRRKIEDNERDVLEERNYWDMRLYRWVCNTYYPIG